MSTEQQIGAKPVGFMGLLAGRLMNLIHRNQYRSIVNEIGKNTNAPVKAVLDIGCGGGIAVKLLAGQFADATIYGIDHAAEMVQLSMKTNRRAVNEGRVKILQNSIDQLELADNSIDVATAFDTINFWPDYDVAMREIKRVLAPAGRLIIVNGYPAEGSKWYEFVTFKNDKAYEAFLNQHGFQVDQIEIQGHTIVIEASVKKILS
ncbi:MAG: class I SAM-dependent methyltransferase [Anaerolineaceae bacterium]|nr:class I SAM-dependent methyltransferase [Anaerolineaceae bacterium]